MNENYYSLRETAKYLNVSISTIRSWIRKGMPAHRVGYKLWKCLKNEVEDWLRLEKA